MEKIRAAIIGLGRIASLLEEDSLREKPCTHAGAISANPDCVLSGGCDTDEERCRLFANRWKVPVYTEAPEMIRAQNPDILVIATHPDSHYEYCRLAAACNIPVVICEKPLADTLSAARKIASLAAQGTIGRRGTTIIINHERRYSADYIKAKEIIASGKLGPLLSVRAVLCMSEKKRLLDVFWHDGTHLADALMFLTGLTLKHRRRWGAKLSASKGTAWLEGELKQKPVSVPVIIEIGAGRDHLVFEIEFSCTSGRLRIGNDLFEVWESAESPYAEKFRSLKKIIESFEGPTGYFANMAADAVACFREGGGRPQSRRPVSSAADGLAVIEYLNSVKALH